MTKKDELLKELEEIKELEDDWDNYGADPIDEKIIENTKFLIENLRILPDCIAPLPWGAVQLEWERKNPYNNEEIYIEVEVCLPKQEGSNANDYLSTFIMITDEQQLIHEVNKTIPFAVYNLLNDTIDFFLFM